MSELWQVHADPCRGMLELQSASEARGGEVTASLIGTGERPAR
jgi:hypothetical protein